MPTLLIDSGYLVALATERDQLHPRAMRWAKSLSVLKAITLVVTEHVLLEAVNKLSNVDSRARAVELVRSIRFGSECTFIPSSFALLDAGSAMFVKYSDKEWSLTDCISFTVMHQHGITAALAYDHHFVQAGFDALLRRDP